MKRKTIKTLFVLTLSLTLLVGCGGEKTLEEKEARTIDNTTVKSVEMALEEGAKKVYAHMDEEEALPQTGAVSEMTKAMERAKDVAKEEATKKTSETIKDALKNDVTNVSSKEIEKALGLASDKIGKQYECLNCKHKW